MAKTMLHGTVKRKRRRGGQKKRWEDNIKERARMDLASSTRTAEKQDVGKGLLRCTLLCPNDLAKL